MNKNRIKIILSILVVFILVIPSFVFAGWLDFAIGEDNWLNSQETGFDLGWYQVSDRQIGICSKDLTSEFFGDYSTNVLMDYGLGNLDERIYDLTIAINPVLEETVFTDENGVSEYLFTVGWYIQGLSNLTRTHKISVFSSSWEDIPLNDAGDTEEEINLLSGKSGFYSAYTTKNYTKFRLTIGAEIYDTRNIPFIELGDQ